MCATYFDTADDEFEELDEEKFPEYDFEEEHNEGLDYSTGNGSSDGADCVYDSDAKDWTSYTTQSRTSWDRSDVPQNKKRQFGRFEGYMKDCGPQERTQFNRDQGKRRDIEIWCDRCHFVDTQENRVHEIIDEIDIDEMGSPNWEALLLSAMTIAVNQTDCQRPKRLRPHSTFETYKPSTDGYEELRESMDVTGEQITNLRKRIMEQLD